MDWEPILQEVADDLESDHPVGAFTLLAETLRQGGEHQVEERLEELCEELEARAEVAAALGHSLRGLLAETHVVHALTRSGVPTARPFRHELFRRLGRRLFPEMSEPGELRVLVRTVFHEKEDFRWIDAVPMRSWIRLLDALGMDNKAVTGIEDPLANAIRVLAHHISSLGLQPEIVRRLPHLDNPDSPFLGISDRVLQYIRSFDGETPGDKALLDRALETVAECRTEGERLRAEKGIYGTSLNLTRLSLRLLRLLERMELLLGLTEASDRDFQVSAVTVFREIVRAENTRNHILPHIRESADLLVFQVVEHAARKGSKYITSGRKDYFWFFMASMGGGLLVGIFGLLKTIMGGWSLPLGIQAFLFGVNYSICFVLIYLTGAALATKQPAMTANTLAQALGGPEERHLDQLEELVERVWRSQFISFVGNVVAALPVAFLLSALFFTLTGEPVAGPEKGMDLLQDLHPWQTAALPYAAVAGVYLFLAGVVSGWVDNRNLYTRFPQRVANQPFLVRVLGSPRAVALGEFLDAKLGAIAGNVFLGFALGSTGTIGEILGIPLDIRHIAFSSAHLGTGLEILDLQVGMDVVWPLMVGIAVIGLVNFVVSFGLSLFMGLESRRITWRETRILTLHMARRFLTRPLDWFFPPRKAATADQDAGG